MAESIAVRVACPQDGAAVEAVLGASYPDLMAAGYSADVLARALPLMVRANPALLCSGSYYVAEAHDGTVVGCGGWTSERPGAAGAPIDPTLGHIRHFATHPEWTRRGVARALLRRCLTDARAKGVRRFECYLNAAAALLGGEAKRLQVLKADAEPVRRLDQLVHLLSDGRDERDEALRRGGAGHSHSRGHACGLDRQLPHVAGEVLGSLGGTVQPLIEPSDVISVLEVEAEDGDQLVDNHAASL
jgi:GNAT superfamily N-acetyltransferase